MKLRTSFFNMRVLGKNLARFAPLWALYAAGEILGLMTLNLEKAGYVASDLTFLMGPVGVFHAAYAFLVAACLFGDLFDSRICSGLHAMPMRREGWLLTNLVSGAVFALIPALAGGIVAAVVLGEYGWIAFYWQASSLLQFVFFFGLAVFSAMCAGKRLGMIAVYGILNFLSLLIYWVMDTVFVPLLPGVVLSADWFELFCPVVSMGGDVYVDFYYDNILGGFFRGLIPQAWNYLFLCVGIGILFMVLGWHLYRKRHLETAGDFISFRPMRGLFLLTYAVALGALFCSVTELFVGIYRGYLLMTAGAVIGWFTGWMLLERTVKIFNKKVFLTFAVFALLFTGSLAVTKLDPMGIAAYVPQTQRIAKACLYTQNESYDYELDVDYMGWYITDPTDIAWVQDLHREMMTVKGATDQLTFRVNVQYELENGFRVFRQYDVPAESEAAEALRPFLSDMRSVFSTEELAQVKNSLDRLYIWFDHEEKSVEIYDPAVYEELLEAIEADCKAGTMAQGSYYHLHQENVGYLDLSWTAQWDEGKSSATRHEDIVVYEDSVHTKAFLEALAEKS